MKQNVTNFHSSPHRTTTYDVDKKDFDIETYAKRYYNEYVKQPTEDLVKFVTNLSPQRPPLLVTYFDEAQDLQLLFWILLRILGNQDNSTSMWYVFLGTKSSVSFFYPFPIDSESLDLNHMTVSHRQLVRSLRLHDEVQGLPLPYVALGFDQNAIFTVQAPIKVTMGYLQSIEHLATYGRPMYVNPFAVL